MELTPWNGRKIGLEPQQVAVIVLTRHHFNRQQIGSLLRLSKQNVRDIIGGLCDAYQCPTTDLYGMVMEELANTPSENSEVA